MKKTVLLTIVIMIITVCFSIHTAFAESKAVWEKDKDMAADCLNDVIFENNMFITVGNDGTIKTSTDGEKWGYSKSGTNNNLHKITYYNKKFVVVGDKGTILTSSDGLTWEAIDSGVDSNLRGIAYNGSTAVIVGEGGSILSSENNKKWTRHSLKSGTWLEAVVWYKNKFIAVGDNGTILTSPDSNIWTSRNSGTEVSFYGLAFNNDEVVAVGAHGYGVDESHFKVSFGVTSISSDGDNWVSKKFDKSNLFSVMWNGSEFIAAGSIASYYGQLESLNGKIYTSQNGVDWNENQINNCFRLTGISGNEKKLIAVGERGRIIKSSDAVNWDLVTNNMASDSRNIACNGKTFIMADFDGINYKSFLLLSNDGVNWKRKSLEEIDPMLKSGAVQNIKWTGKEFLITVSSNTPDMFLLSSLDGDSWEVTNIQGQSFNDIFWDSSKYWAVGDSDTMLTSKDKINWDGINFNEKSYYNITSIAYDGKEYVAVEYGGDYATSSNILFSSDGIHWKRIEVGKSGSFTNVTWNGKVFVAVGEKYLPQESRRKGIILTSADGIKWSNNEPADSEALKRVKWNGNIFTAVGDYGYICTSDDGYSWQQLYSPTSNFLYDIAWNDKKTLIIGSNGTVLESDLAGKQVEIPVQSPQAEPNQVNQIVEWKNIREAKGRIFCDICWNGKQFVAVGYEDQQGIILSSPDGTVWNTNYIGNYRLNSVIWNGDVFMIGGMDNGNNSCIIQTSSDGSEWVKKDIGINGVITNMIWNGKVYVATAVNNTAHILTSDDGEKWDDKDLNSFNPLSGAYWNGNMFMISSFGLSNQMYTSSDGYNWESKNSPVGHIARNNKLAVIAGGNGEIYTSEDYKNWTKQTCPTYSGLCSIVWDGNEFITVGFDGKCVVSPSGTDWSVFYLPSKEIIEKVVWNGEKLIAVGQDGVILSGNPINTIKVTVNNTPVIFDVAPEIAGGRTLIPLRSVSEALGAKIEWDESTKTIKATKENTTVVLTVGENTANVNGTSITLDVPATIKDGRTLVPIRFISESFGAEVEWNSEAKVVAIKIK